MKSNTVTPIDHFTGGKIKKKTKHHEEMSTDTDNKSNNDSTNKTNGNTSPLSQNNGTGKEIKSIIPRERYSLFYYNLKMKNHLKRSRQFKYINIESMFFFAERRF